MKIKHLFSRRVTSLLLVFLLVFSIFPAEALAAGAKEDPHIHTEICALEEETSSDTNICTVDPFSPSSGFIGGSAVAWSFENTSGRLTISGSGDCDTFKSAEDQPWAAFRTQINEVWFYDMDALAIPDLSYWFDGCTALTLAEIPYTTPVIGTNAFANCPSLRTVLIYHDGGLTIDDNAFAVNELTSLEIRYMSSSVATADILTSYNWSADNRVVYFEDVYGTSLLATGICSSCGETCDYTLQYEQWTADSHCIRHWCSNCGFDQCGGLLPGEHTFNTNWLCTLCGYQRTVEDELECYHIYTQIARYGCAWYEYCTLCSAVLNIGMSHEFTYTEWSGCNWYSYCSNCDEPIDFGTSHKSYSSGSWEYYSTTQHRRYNTCNDCGQGWYSYGSHSKTTAYTQYSDSQHLYGSYCFDCSTYVGSTSYEQHTYSYGSWKSCNSTQHHRIKTCTLCGYSTYEYASHSLSYGSWSSYNTTQHIRTVNCSCGYNATEIESHNLSYGNWVSSSDTQHQQTNMCPCGYEHTVYGTHSDSDNNGYCDDCQYLMTRFSVTIPVNLTLTASEIGKVYSATNATIINNSTHDVEISSVTVSTGNGWTLVPYDSNMADKKVDSKLIGFYLNGAKTTKTGTNELLVLPGSRAIERNTSFALDYDAVISASSEIIQNEQVLTLVFVIDWASR